MVAGLLLAAVGATFFRYQSLHPCDWMVRDVAETYGVSPAIAQAKIHVEFGLDGVFDPDALDCLLKWWDWRSEGIPD